MSKKDTAEPKYTLLYAKYEKLPYDIRVMPSKVHNGLMGYWYRFWWRVLLGTEFKDKGDK